MVTINIGRKAMIFFSVVILVFAVVGFSVAFGGNQPAVVGHTAGEIERCADGETLVMSGGEWTCGVGSGGGMSFGSWVSRNNNQNYGPELSDGFIVVSTNWAYLDVYVGDSVAGLSIVSKEAPASQGPQPSWGSITLPIKKGQYWKVVGNTASTPLIYWVPIVSSGGGSGSGDCIIVHPFDSAEIGAADFWLPIDIPSMCIDNTCTIIWTLYDSSGVDGSNFEMATYYQSSGENNWRSRGTESSGASNFNGDNAREQIVSHNSGTNTLHDDCGPGDCLGGTFLETSPNQWSFRDTNQNHATELIVCP